MFNLTEMTADQLQHLVDKVQKELTLRREGELKKIKEEIIKSAREVGLKVYFEEGSQRKPRKAGATGQTYRNPTNPEQTWGGRGKRPRWLNDLLAKGHQLAEFIGA